MRWPSISSHDPSDRTRCDQRHEASEPHQCLPPSPICDSEQRHHQGNAEVTSILRIVPCAERVTQREPAGWCKALVDGGHKRSEQVAVVGRKDARGLGRAGDVARARKVRVDRVGGQG